MGVRLRSDSAASGAVWRAWAGRARPAAATRAARAVRHAARRISRTAERQFPAAAARFRSAKPAADQSAEQSIWESESEWLVHDSEWLDDLHASRSGSTPSRRAVTLDRKDRVVQGAAHVLDAVTVSRGMHAIRENHHIQVVHGIDPQRCACK